MPDSYTGHFIHAPPALHVLIASIGLHFMHGAVPISSPLTSAMRTLRSRLLPLFSCERRARRSTDNASRTRTDNALPRNKATEDAQAERSDAVEA